MLEAHKDSVVKQVTLNSVFPNIVSKYRWLADYHNFKFTDLYIKDDWVEGYFEELRDRILISSVAFPSFESVAEG